MITRRRIIVGAGAGALCASFSSLARAPDAQQRLGVLSTSIRGGQFYTTLRDRLRRQGYEEGKNIAIEWRFTEGRDDRLPALAHELSRLDLDVVVAQQNSAIAAMKQATQTVPIVMHAGTLPVENGFVASLARPGGNITGGTWSGPELTGKVLQTLKQAAPKVKRVAEISNPNYSFAHLWTAEADRTAELLDLQLLPYQVRQVGEVKPALNRVAAAKPDALWLSGDPVMLARWQDIVLFATEHRLVSISDVAFWADNGFLLAYSPSRLEAYDRTARFVDRILRGAKPEDLPVDQPTRYELIINLKTARAIAFTVPSSLLARADRVIG